jgi:5'-3' exonuclease
MNNIILVDTSYTNFHRFYATLRWYSFANKEEYKEKIKGNNMYDFTKDKLFIEKYEKMYVESLKKLVGNKVFKDSIIIYCEDSPQKTIWRNELIKCYKGTREDHSKKINIIPVFRHTFKKIIPQLVKENKNIHEILVNHMEGDDVIAVCSKYIRKKYPDKKVYVVSGDKDFYQLGYNNLYFADYKKKEHLNLTRPQAKEALRHKIINGDCSDNIKSILQNVKLTKVEKNKIMNDKKDMIKYLNENKNVRKKYILNRKLISFKYIPYEYQKKVLKIIKNII